MMQNPPWQLISPMIEFTTPLVLFKAAVVVLASVMATRLMMVFNIHDTPSHRSSHLVPTPRAGGVGIIIGFFTGMMLFSPTKFPALPPFWNMTLLGCSVFVLVIVSFFDDLREVPLRYKLLTQIGVAILALMGGLIITTLPLPFEILLSFGSFSIVISAIWIIFFTNVFNFMDGLDGLTAGSSAIAGFFGVLLSLQCKNPVLFMVTLSLFLSCLGFLFYNFSPARIFMGDVGSQFLGFLWAILLFLGVQADGAFSVYTIPILFFAFLYDVSLTIIRRLWKRQSIWQPHRTFLFHLLYRSGYTHRTISLIYMSFAFIQGIGSLLVQRISPHSQGLLLLPYLFLMLGYTVWVQQQAKSTIRRKVHIS